jgi:hypothetical protein
VGWGRGKGRRPLLAGSPSNSGDWPGTPRSSGSPEIFSSDVNLSRVRAALP